MIPMNLKKMKHKIKNKQNTSRTIEINSDVIKNKRKIIKNINESTYKDLFERNYNNNINKTPRRRYNIQRDNIGEIFNRGMGVIERGDISSNPTKGNFEQLINQISVNNQDKFMYKHYE